ncbi:unnamed protein product [Ostreobium quekettii]|uniref:Uncharacterized protein n=1 Tax=Ostreobium quekettii TaxID=121088 RepID=A0A8S1JD34_9CHLO|nr:unnamed protein product [Ostreobium quekettii]
MMLNMEFRACGALFAPVKPALHGSGQFDRMLSSARGQGRTDAGARAQSEMLLWVLESVGASSRGGCQDSGNKHVAQSDERSFVNDDPLEVVQFCSIIGDVPLISYLVSQA